MIINNSNFKIVVVNGRPESGKTTFEHLCQEHLTREFCKMRSTVDEVKRIAFECGWDGKKTLKSRRFLSDLKDLLTNYNDLPFQDIKQFAINFENDLIASNKEDFPHLLFVDAREPEGIQRLQNELGAVSLLIRRPDTEFGAVSNHADAEVFNYNYDYVIINDGSIEDLNNKAINFIELLFYDKAPWEV